MPPSKPLGPAYQLTREVEDVTPATRDAIERALFLGLSRDICARHARYSVDRFVLRRARGKTMAHVTRCCEGDDDQISYIVDFSPAIAEREREQVLARTQARRGAPFDLETTVAIGFFRRRRGERLTLEATLNLKGDERMQAGQATRLQELIADARARKRLRCEVHGPSAIGDVHIERGEEQTTVDIEVCCARVHSTVDDVQRLVDEALLSGPVVAISAGKIARRKRTPGG